MGFLASGGKAAKRDGTPPLRLLHKLECRICPLDKIKENFHPHMKPTGASAPLVYILGEAPGLAEDKSGKHFVGKSGKLIRARLPDDMMPFIRFNNVVRTRPIDNKLAGEAAEKTIVECCRPSIERDIAASKPKAIFGFGATPLHWALEESGIYRWRGRRIPVEIGGHACWYYSFTHPAALLRAGRRAKDKDGRMQPHEIGSEDERAFVFDLKKAFAEIDELPEPHVYSLAEVEAGVEIIPCTADGLRRLEGLLHWAKSQLVVGVDLETNALRPYGAKSKILTAAIGTPRQSFAFALDHKEAEWTKAQRKAVDKLFKDFLMEPHVKKTVHQLGFEMEWLAFFYGIEVLRAGNWEDSVNQAAALDERFGERKCFSLDFLVLQYFGFHLKTLSNMNRKDMENEPLLATLKYNALDAKFHCLLFLAQDERLRAEGLQRVYEENRRCVPTLVMSQIKGVVIDQGENKKLKDEYEGRIRQTLADILAIKGVAKFRNKKGQAFSPTSNDDVGEYLHHIGYHDFKSVDETELNKVDHPIIEPIIRLRKASKLLSTYITPYGEGSEFIWNDGKIHMIINSFGTVTNRTSAEDPNVQNMPKRVAESKRMRKQLKAVKGGLVCSIDYGQIQARGIAMMSKDKVFVKSLWERHDIHQDEAERLAKRYPPVMDKFSGEKNPMKAFRNDVKNQWTFPLFFGSDLRARAEQLSIPEDKLEIEYDRFWGTFTGVHDWQKRLLSEYQKKGIVRHLDGRLNRAPISLNQVINYPIQGVERQIVMNAMNKLSEYATKTGDMNYQPNLMIHDDLTTFYDKVAADKIDDYVEVYVTKMLEIDFDFVNVPLTVEVAIGNDMYNMQEVLVASSDTWGK